LVLVLPVLVLTTRLLATPCAHLGTGNSAYITPNIDNNDKMCDSLCYDMLDRGPIYKEF